MRIRALSVFEGVVYHCWCADRTAPARPTLEVEAVLRPGDADAGPLLLAVADYVTMLGGPQHARAGLDQLRAKGRIVEHLGVPHIRFPTWTAVDDTTPPGAAPDRPTDPGPTDPG